MSRPSLQHAWEEEEKESTQLKPPWRRSHFSSPGLLLQDPPPIPLPSLVAPVLQESPELLPWRVVRMKAKGVGQRKGQSPPPTHPPGTKDRRLAGAQ